MDYQWDFSIVLQNLPVLLRGVLVTLELWALAVILGGSLGFSMSLWRVFGRNRVLGYLPAAFIEVFRNTPVLIQLVWFYYAFPVLFDWRFTAFEASILALTLYGAAYYAEIFRAGLQSVARGQWEAARALGMTRGQSLRRVIWPQAFRRILPALTNRMIELAKVTSLTSMLSVHELMYQGHLLSSTYYRPLEILSVVALVYFILIWPGSYLASRLERRLAIQH